VGTLLVGALLWVIEVALMTSDGFSGNIRYLVMPAAIVFLCAGVGIGWLLRAILGRAIAGTGVLALAVGAVAGIAFAAPDVDHVRTDLTAITYQARLSDSVSGLVARAGGPARLRACGEIYTGPFQVPLVAWNMRVHTTQVESTPAIPPAVVFRTRSIPSSIITPSLRGLGDPSGQRTLSTAPGWRIVTVCRGAGA
jgi:hypothetical protein